MHCCPPDTKATTGSSTSRIRRSCLGSIPCCDCKQLEKVQRWAARFVKWDYRSTTSVSSLISQLGWQTLSDHRRNSRLSLMYKMYFHLTFSSFFQAHSFSWWRHILCLVLWNRSLQVLLLSSYHCWLECPLGICEASSFHSFVRCAIHSSLTNSI